jgi:glycerophosphoryl diester phosphodiesterase
MLTADGVPVCLHDPQLGRTVAGQGAVSDVTAEALAAMDAGGWFAPHFKGEPVPTYRQVFDFCQANAIWMNVEIKPVPGFEAATGKAVAECTRQWLAENAVAVAPLFSSFSVDALTAAKTAAPEIARGLLLDRIAHDWRRQLRALDAVALHTNHKHLTVDLAAEIKQAGYGLFCYTVNEVARAREILSWGVDGFCTDRIDLIGADFA